MSADFLTSHRVTPKVKTVVRLTERGVSRVLNGKAGDVFTVAHFTAAADGPVAHVNDDRGNVWSLSRDEYDVIEPLQARTGARGGFHDFYFGDPRRLPWSHVAIGFDSQATKLLGANGGYYLPCNQCHNVYEVALNVVSFLCLNCDEHDGAFTTFDNAEDQQLHDAAYESAPYGVTHYVPNYNATIAQAECGAYVHTMRDAYATTPEVATCPACRRAVALQS